MTLTKLMTAGVALLLLTTFVAEALAQIGSGRIGGGGTINCTTTRIGNTTYTTCR